MGARGPRDAHRLSIRGAAVSLGRGSELQQRGEGRGGGRGREGAASLFGVTRAESQSAHANELPNAIKNIYIFETLILSLM